MNKPDGFIHPNRLKYWKIVTSRSFEYFIMAVIILNLISMAIGFEDAPYLYSHLLDLSNYVFTAIFVIEMYLKLRAYNWRYF